MVLAVGSRSANKYARREECAKRSLVQRSLGAAVYLPRHLSKVADVMKELGLLDCVICLANNRIDGRW